MKRNSFKKKQQKGHMILLLLVRASLRICDIVFD